MYIYISISMIAVISVILAIRSVEHELSPPKEVVGIKIAKHKPVSGVILFLKKRIVHYSSNSS